MGDMSRAELPFPLCEAVDGAGVFCRQGSATPWC